MRARFIQVVGTYGKLRVYWGHEGCPTFGYHNAEIPLGTVPELGAWDHWGKASDYPDERWPTHCDGCGLAAPATVTRQVFTHRQYNTDSWRPEPGDLYWLDWYPCVKNGQCVYGWTNCDGRHLVAVCPNGREWDIDSRASNCTMPDDTLHRCWVRTGAPPLITVGKSGLTCSAGGGSIQAGSYHGFLRNGNFT